MNGITQNSCALIQQGQAVATGAQVFTVGDAAQVCRRSPSSIRRIASELRIEPQRTGTGQRIFTGQQVQRLAEEISRREQEAARR